MLFVAYAKNNSEKLNKLVSDCYGHALLDSGCSTTVCGEMWLSNYYDSLSDYATFTFADGVSVKSIKKINLPYYIRDMRAMIEVDVVSCNIPLLLSKYSMKKGKMCLNFGDDSAVINGRKMLLKSNDSGHYLLPLSF